jgi:hypothetical protein
VILHGVKIVLKGFSVATYVTVLTVRGGGATVIELLDII